MHDKNYSRGKGSSLQEAMSCFIAAGIGAAAATFPGNEQHYSVAFNFTTSSV